MLIKLASQLANSYEFASWLSKPGWTGKKNQNRSNSVKIRLTREIGLDRSDFTIPAARSSQSKSLTQSPPNHQLSLSPPKSSLLFVAGTDIIFVRNQGREPEFGSEHNSGSREDHSYNFIVQDQASNVTRGC